jgi:hypothetical protein
MEPSRFINVFTTARHLSLSYARLVQSITSQLISLWSVSIFSSHLRNFQRSRSPPWTSWPWKMGPIGCSETSAQNYHSTLCNIPEERRSRRRWIVSFTFQPLHPRHPPCRNLLERDPPNTKHERYPLDRNGHCSGQVALNNAFRLSQTTALWTNIFMWCNKL